MRTETRTTIVFPLPSGLELHLTNATPQDVEYLKGIETAVLAEREACAKACEDVSLYDEDDPAEAFASAIRARGESTSPKI